jgi:hypothetical protein
MTHKSSYARERVVIEELSDGSSTLPGSTIHFPLHTPRGGVAEWLKATVSKAVVP